MASAVETALERISSFERPTRWAFEIGLVVLFAMIAARLIWLVVYPVGAVASFTDRPLAAPISGSTGAFSLSIDRTIILSSNPFETDAVDEVIASVPETSLNLQLDGLRMSSEGNIAGNAIIRTPRGETQNFRVGDEIIPGVTLDRILSDRVIINRDGASETLMLGGRGAGLSVIGDESQAVSALTRPSATPASQSQVSAPPIAGQIEGPEVLFSAMSAALVGQDDSVTGYQLSARGDGETMRLAGFEPGDILLQINGTSVADADLQELLERFGQAEVAILRVNRDGIERTIRLEIGE